MIRQVAHFSIVRNRLELMDRGICYINNGYYVLKLFGSTYGNNKKRKLPYSMDDMGWYPFSLSFTQKLYLVLTKKSKETTMTIKLLHSSPLWLASHAIRMSHDNHDKSDTHNSDDNIGTKDRSLISRVGNKLKHKSVLEQLVYWFDIDGISRACLQELARHRTARLTVKSSRYTLNELRTYKYFSRQNREDYANMKDAEKFVVYTGDAYVDDAIFDALMNLQDNICRGNDIAKYCLPEAFKTRLQFQLDGRNLQNFLALRTSKDALWEIRLLAKGVYDALPSEHKYLYSEYVMDNINTDTTNDNTIPTE